MSKDEIENLQMLFMDIVEDAEKGADSTDLKDMERRLQSILSCAAELQRQLK